MEKTLTIAGLCGSLRNGSYNRKILEYAAQTAPEHVKIDILEIGDLPFFNEDIEANPPETVIRFREKISLADGILFATPEYNYSVPAVLKNAIEWGSRPAKMGVMNEKIVGIMGVSTGMVGTVRAQFQLRQMCVQVNMHPLNRPEVIITFARKKFDEQGNLVDEHTQEKIRNMVLALVDTIKK
jgi:chromate reductase